MGCERTVGELVTALDVSQPAVAKHLGVLREVGLVESRVDAQRRFYRLRPQPLRELDAWLAPYRAMWSATSTRRINRNEKEAKVNGELEQGGDRWRLRFTRNLEHRLKEVWEAITRPDHLKTWFPQEIVGDGKKGATLEFRSIYAEANFKGEVLVVDPPKLLECRWGTDTLRFEISPNGSGSTLTLLDTFDEMGKAARDAAGWHVYLDALERDLDGRPSKDSPGENWDEVHEDYVSAYGPQASTIGPTERRDRTV